jgi:hypothetical protein
MELFDIDEYDLKGRLDQFLFGSDSKSSYEDSDNFDEFDESVEDIDFSSLDGENFKTNFTKVNTKIQKVIVPQDRSVIVEGTARRRFKRPEVRKAVKEVKQTRDTQKSASNNVSRRSNVIKPFARRKVIQDLPVEKNATIRGRNRKLISKVIVPRDREVIVEGISKFILSQDKRDEKIKQIGYKDGKKLKELILEINNDTDIDFNLNLFDPSMPLDYLYATSQNLNNRVTVAGGNAQYSDICFNLLANPPIIHSAYFTFSGPSGQLTKQTALAMKFINKNMQGYKKIDPVNLSLKIDNMQTFNYVIAFDLNDSLNRPFIPDGMDVINYTIFAGMRVTMAYFYEQVQIKDVFYEEARESKRLL